jgi:hypothetical protein
MIFSCFAVLGFLIWIGASLFLLFRARTRRAGFISLSFALVAFALTVWWSDPGRMTKEPPEMEEIVGTWKCYHVSPGFLKRAGISRDDFSSTLVFAEDSTVIVESMPDESDTVSAKRSWKLQRPGLTPAGAWTVEISSGPSPGPHRLVCRKKMGFLTLSKGINPVYGERALYRRVSPGIEARESPVKAKKEGQATF